MAVHARLKNEFMEDERYHNLMIWLNESWDKIISIHFQKRKFSYCKFEPQHDKTQQTDLCAHRRLRSVWACAQSLLCGQWVAKDPNFLHADSEYSDHAGRMPRLTWVFAGRTGHFVGFVMRRLIYVLQSLHNFVDRNVSCIYKISFYFPLKVLLYNVLSLLFTKLVIFKYAGSLKKSYPYHQERKI